MNKSTKKRRPWNATNEAVYSISSNDENGKMNMNIATYVVAITMKPKRYVLAIYRNTQTHKNIFESKQPFLLQSLSRNQMSLVPLLGKRSGLKVDKANLLTKRNVPILRHENLSCLSDSFFVLSMKPEQYIKVGDHDLVIAEACEIVMQNDQPQLMTADLQEAGIIG